jgi:hypothetical protein
MWFGQASSQELYLQRPNGHFVCASAQDFLAAPNQSLLNSSLTFFLTFHCPPHNPVERKVAKAAIPLLWYPPNTWKHKFKILQPEHHPLIPREKRIVYLATTHNNRIPSLSRLNWHWNPADNFITINTKSTSLLTDPPPAAIHFFVGKNEVSITCYCMCKP